jgi:flagellin-like hook-associated protein FlgL
LTVTAVQSSSDDSWGLSFSNPNGYQIDLYGDFVSGSMEVTHTVADSDGNFVYDPATATALSSSNPVRVAAMTAPLAGPAAYRSTIDAGAFQDGVDLSANNVVTVTVTDNTTGGIVSKDLTLGSDSGSVSFSSYVSLIESAGNTGFVDEGYTFASTANDDGTYSISFEPAGDYTVSISGDSVTSAFGGPMSATGAASNMDGLTFTSMDDVLAELNAQFEAVGLAVSATYSRGGDTFNFYVTGGPADGSSTIALSGDALIDLGFTGTLAAVGGGTDKAEDVRYVSQIDISTRETAKMAMTVVDAALETLASVRGGLGAVANRLESTISNLMNISENTSASMSRVMDADFAQESTRLARAQILQEASVAMLAQANQAAQSVLKLLQ